MLKGRASNFYYNKITSKSYNFKTIIRITKTYFETEENY